MNLSILGTHLLKTVHLLFVVVGVGGAVAQLFLLLKYRRATHAETAASENMALTLTKFVEFYGLVLAFVTGLILALMTGAFGTGGYLHAKTTLVVVMLGFSHVELRNLKRMVALRAEGKAAEADQVKQNHLTLGAFSLLMVVVIVFLVINKPF